MTLVLLVLPACGGDRGGALDDEPGATGERSTSAPLVVLLRYGGDTGSYDSVSVDRLGVATVVSDRSPAPSIRTLSSGDLASLRRALERSEMATLQRNYLDPRAADAYQYDVTYQGITVTADEAVIPHSLRPVVDQLSRLIST